jgi:glycosyltransferase involved in cell wall biosynthesis
MRRGGQGAPVEDPAVISVVVPVRNGMPWIEDQLCALTAQQCDQPWEVIVADNGSTDETALVVREWAKRSHRIRLVDASDVRGPGATRNVGVGEARGDLLAFCDADDVVQPGWLNAHVSALAEADISAGVFDPWTINGLEAPPGVSSAPPPALGLFGFLPAAGSNNLAMRRIAFEGVGGFAPELMTGEDFELSWRAQLAGYRYVTSPDAVVARRNRQGFWAVLRRYAEYGRCGPVLFRRFRDDGLRRDLLLAAKTWAWLVVSTPRLVRPEFRDHWARLAGWRAGCLVESLRQGVLFL